MGLIFNPMVNGVTHETQHWTVIRLPHMVWWCVGCTALLRHS